MDQPLVRTSLIFTSALVGGVVSPLAGVPLPLDKLVEGLFAQHDAGQRKKLKAFGNAMAEELAIIGPKDEGTRNAVCLIIETAIQRFPIKHRRLVALNLDPDAATAELAPRLAFATQSDRTELEHWCKTLIHRFYEKLPRHADVLAELLPVSLAELLKGQAETLTAVTAVKDDTSDIKSMLTTLLEHSEKSTSGQARLQQEIARLREERQLDRSAVEAFFQEIGAPVLPDQPIDAQLATIAERYNDLVRQASRPTQLTVEVEAERQKATELLRAWRLDDADALLRQLDEREQQSEADQEALLHQSKRNRASIRAERAGIARTRLRYRDAATLLAEAADLTAFDPETSWRHRLAQAGVLWELGREFGDNAALTEAIATYETALGLAPRDTRPDDWATTQNKFGNALWTLGERESGPTTLELAVRAYEATLEERTRERVPLDWAQTQNSLGNALATLGARESSTSTLARAVAAYELALEERTRRLVPLDWAMTQSNLGNALATLGARESGAATMKRAVAAYELALGERARERVPLNWAQTQNNLGSALLRLGERESGTATLERAIRAYELALEEWTRERVPLNWALTQNNLGSALRTLGERQSDTTMLQRAVAAYELALEERTRERVPLDWATTQNNLGNALRAISERESGTATLIRAIAASVLALEERTRQRVPLDWAITQNTLGAALARLGERESDSATLERAVEAYELALEEGTRERVPMNWAFTQNNLGTALALLGEQQNGTTMLQRAVAAFELALEIFTAAKADSYVDGAQRNLERVQLLIAEREGE